VTNAIAKGAGQSQEVVLIRYAGKILGVRLYRAAQQEFFAIDFATLDKLEPFIDELLTSESDITPAGKSFLTRFWGLERLVGLLAERRKLREHDAEDVEWLLDWLSNIEPLAVLTFIEEGRGTIKLGATLRDDLLPPECDR
jgi:hypothetical protein